MVMINQITYSERNVIMEKTILFKDWAKEWLRYEKNFIKESSYGNYSTIIYNHLTPYLGDCYIAEINQAKIQDLIIYLSQKGRKDKKGGLSEKTVKDIINVLKKCLKSADCNDIEVSKLYKLDFPRNRQEKQLHVFSKEEQNKLQNIILNNITNRNLGILFSLQTGVRIGELCAIQNKDINIREKTVKISKTLQRTFIKTDINNESKIIITSPKSIKSFRTIPLSDILIKALRQLDISEPSYYLISGGSKYIEPRTYMNYYKKFLESADINYINFHGLRHTFATRCIEAGGDSKAVSEILGHSSIKLTLDLYVHPQMDAKRKCVELVNLL